MEIKGTAFLTRMEQAIKLGGEARWESFWARARKGEPFFAQPVLATTLIPVAAWLRFMDAYVAHYFTCSPAEAYWQLGEGSATWALGPGGPYNLLIPRNRDLRTLVEKGWLKIFSVYFSRGMLRTRAEARVAHAWIGDIPLHPYFEMLVNAYFQKSLELLDLGAVSHERVKGADSPDREIYYRFTVAPGR